MATFNRLHTIITEAIQDCQEAKNIQHFEAARNYLLGLLRGLYEANLITYEQKEAYYQEALTK